MSLNVGSIVATLKASVDDLKKGFSDAEDSVSNFSEKTQADFKKVGAAFTAAGAALALMAKDWIDAAGVQEAAETKLTTLAVNASGATLEQVDALKQQASALQELGVVGDEVTMVGQAQLATFALQSDSIATLTPSILDMAVAQKGVNVTQEDMISIGNMVGKVMGGQVSALSRLGVTFSDVQEEILKTGTEEEKAAALAEILAQNFGGLNEAMADTTQGAIAQMNNAFGDMKEILGDALLPAVSAIAEKLKDFFVNMQENHPTLLKVIAIGTALAAALLLVVGPIIMLIGFLPAIWAGLQMVASVIAIIVTAAGWWILAIAAVIAAGVALYIYWDEIMAFLGNIWQTIVDTAVSVWDGLMAYFMAVWETIKEIFNLAIMIVLGILITLLEWLGIDWQQAWNDMVEFVAGIWEGIQKLIDKVTKAFKAIWDFFTTDTENSWSGMWTGIWNTIVEYWNIITTYIVEALDWVLGFFGLSTDSLLAVWSNTWDAIANVVSSVWENIKELVKSGVNWVIEKINFLIQQANKVAEIVPGITPIATIPLLAEGGNITGRGSAIVGEAGPELIDLPQGARVTPLDGAGVGTTININNPIVRNDQDLERMRDMLGRSQELARFGLAT